MRYLRKSDRQRPKTAAEYRQYMKLDARASVPRKYRNNPRDFDGVRFDSDGEANRWAELLILGRVGQIGDLDRQVRIKLEVNGTLICTYVADFAYREAGKYVVEEFKGFWTPDAKLKWKLAQALYPDWVFKTNLEP